MKSPFAVFRKYQKVAMVALVGMAMFAFIILDPATGFSGEMPPTLLALIFAMLLGGLGWLFGMRTQKSREFALIGAAIGAVGGFAIPMLNAPAPAVETRLRNFSDRELNELIQKRQIANRFMVQATQAAGVGFYDPRFNFGLPVDQDVIRGYFLRQEADALGIKVTDQAITDYIHSRTMNRLSAKDFVQIRGDMRLSEAALYDVLRDEIKAQQALLMLRPRQFETPAEHWELYRRLKVRQAIDVAPIPVKDFVDQVPAPSEAELLTFFDRYKTQFQQNAIVPEPAFGQPPKVQVEYLATVYTDVEKEVPPVTDAEIEQYYNDNKERFRNNPIPEQPAAGTAPTGEAATTPIDPQFTPESDAKPAQPAAPAEPKPETPAEQPATPPADAPQTPEAQPQSAIESQGDDEELVAFAFAQDENAPAATQPASDAAQPTTPPAETPATETPAAPAGEREPVEAPREPAPLPEFQPLDELLRDQIRDQLLNERTLPLMKDKINKASEFMFTLRDKYLVSAADEAGEKKEGEKPKIPAEDISKELQDYAAKNGLKYVKTPLVSALDMLNPDAPQDLQIGQATEPVESEIDRTQARRVIDLLFGTEIEQVYIPQKGQDFGMSTNYAYWKTDHVNARVPNFDDPGIREQVLAAFQLEKARPFAEKRAEELAEIVRKSDKSMAETLGDKTATGNESPEKLVVRESEQFSWLRMSFAPNPNAFQAPQIMLSQISAVEHAGPDFMAYIFDKLQNGEVGVAPNADKSIYYVVKVRDREPSTEAGIEALRQQFLTENMEFLFRQFDMQKYQFAQDEWMRNIELMYDFRPERMALSRQR